MAGTDASAVSNYLARFRADHPLGDETVKLSLIAVTPGFQQALSRRMWLLVVAAPVVVVTMLIGTTASYTVGFVFLNISLVAIVVLAWKHGRAFPPMAAMLSDRRLVVVAGVPGRDPEVRQNLAATEVTWATVTEWTGSFPLRHHVCTVTLGGAGGIACELEMPRANPDHLRLIFTEAGLTAGPG